MNKIYLFLFLVLLSACGGGGGGGSVEVIQNGPPTITNNTFTFSVLEDQEVEKLVWSTKELYGIPRHSNGIS